MIDRKDGVEVTFYKDGNVYMLQTELIAMAHEPSQHMYVQAATDLVEKLSQELFEPETLNSDKETIETNVQLIVPDGHVHRAKLLVGNKIVPFYKATIEIAVDEPVKITAVIHAGNIDVKALENNTTLIIENKDK